MVHNGSRDDGNQNAHVGIIGRLHGGALMSPIMHHPLGMDTTLLKSNLAVMRSVVLVLTLLEYSTQLPPTVQRTQCGMVFSGQRAHTMCR